MSLTVHCSATIKKADVVIIDEVSMCRMDMLDSIQKSIENEKQTKRHIQVIVVWGGGTSSSCHLLSMKTVANVLYWRGNINVRLDEAIRVWSLDPDRIIVLTVPKEKLDEILRIIGK